MTSPATQVVVEPDTLGPWLGLVGVGVGVILGGVLEWWRGWLADRKTQRSEIDQAAQELRAAASTLMIAVSAFKNAPQSPETTFTWTQAMLTYTSRLQAAAWTVSRKSPHLADAALRLDQAAVTFLQSGGKDDTIKPVQEAQAAFTALARDAKP